MLPGYVFCFVFLPTSFYSVENVAADSNVELVTQCPFTCVEEDSCEMPINDTDCEEGFVCCMDKYEPESTTEFIDWDVTTEYSPETTSIPAVEIDETEEEGYHYREPAGSEVLYSQSSEDPSLVDNSLSEAGSENLVACPSTCVHSTRVNAECEYVAWNALCSSDSVCCVEESEMLAYDENYDFDFGFARVHGISKRASRYLGSTSCPGTCVHPSHAMFCEEILNQFPCPLNAKCCIKRSIDRVMSGPSVIECTGQCVPLTMQGYCFPPNELVLGPTTCAPGTTCCVTRSSENFARPPSVSGMHIPSNTPIESVRDGTSQMVMGHLAIDDLGTVFKVGTNGQVSKLPQLSHMDHLRNKFIKLTTYERPDGNMVIFSDESGNLYQQFLPHQSTVLRESLQTGDTSRKPTESPEEEQEDVVVLADDDEELVPTTAQSTTASSTPDIKAPRPQCPGSCMSYFLRFTCFRGYATYDGFSCPRRSVCCAKLKDIEDHEQYLKSLSPYFQTHYSSKDDALPRCGIKGRRDAPRVIGGKESLPGEWCWQVAIINLQNQYLCGGVLIDDSWVLTAAHCVIGSVRSQSVFVRVGVTDLKSVEDNNNGQTVRAFSIIVHHNFNRVNLDNNIALIRLNKPVTLGPNVCVICLPTQGQMPKENTKCTVTGYGFVSDGDMSLVVREAQVPIIDDMDCMTNVSDAMTNPFILPSSSFCAGGNGQQDACQGDAGGPLACEVDGYHELVGIVSWGLGCDRSDVPNIYVKIPTFMGWINQVIGSNSHLESLA